MIREIPSNLGVTLTFDGSGVDGVHLCLEPVQQPAAPAPAAEFRLAPLEVMKCVPEDGLDECRVTVPVGVRARIARRRRDANPCDGPSLEPDPVADIIEAGCMGQLHKDHGRHVTEDAEGSGLGFDAVLDCRRVDDGARNALEEFGQHVDMVEGWPGGRGHFWVVLHYTTNPARFRRHVTRYFGNSLTLVEFCRVGCL